MKKTILSLLLFVLFCTTHIFAQDFYGGTGTYDDPFLISTPQHLDNIRKYLGPEHADKHFLIINEIDLDVPPYNGEKGWAPIGNPVYSEKENIFYGKLYGYMDGLCGSGTIKNLKLINTPEDGFRQCTGLFACLGGKALIKNIGLENYTINSYAQFVGVLVGYFLYTDNDTACLVENCYTIGNVTCNSNVFGGIVGSCGECNIKNCYTIIDINNEHPAPVEFGGITSFFLQDSI